MHQSKAFTLAEVLIALVVIGIIAAITLTTVMPNIQERVNSQRQANIVYKITQATNLMKANGALVNGFESTDAFVDELQKYLKIMKRCDSEHIADCWPTKTVKTSDGEEYEVSKAKTRPYIGLKDNYKDNKNVGIVLADGACLIMTYNPANAGISIGDPLFSTNKLLPVGGKYNDFLEYTTNTTSGLAFVMDVNGSKGPNKEKNKNNNKLYDIRSFNGAYFSSCGGTIFDGKCYTVVDTPSTLNCYDNPTNEFCATTNNNGESYTDNFNDSWAGAQSDCAALGSRTPTQNELYEICSNPETLEFFGLTGFNGYFWTSGVSNSADCGNVIHFIITSGYNGTICVKDCNLRYRNRNKVICVK